MRLEVSGDRRETGGEEEKYSQVRGVEPKMMSKFSVILTCRFIKISQLGIFVSGKLFLLRQQ